MEQISTVDYVTLNRRGSSITGTLILSKFHLVFRFVSANIVKEIWICYPMVERMNKARGSSWLSGAKGRVVDGRGDKKEGREVKPEQTEQSGTIAIPGAGSTSPNSSTISTTTDSGSDPGTGPGAVSDHYAASHIRLQCKDFTYYSFDFLNETICGEVFSKLSTLVMLPKLEGVRSFYAFAYRPNMLEEKLAVKGWEMYDPVKEYERQGLFGGYWRMSTINGDYKYCASYPRVLVVPQTISDNVLKHAGKFRSKQRIPAIVYRHRSGNHNIIARCAQPLVGLNIQNRSIQDEKLIGEIFNSQDREREEKGGEWSDQPQRNLLVDLRPITNAMAQHALGAGTEYIDNYRQKTKGHKMKRENLDTLIEPGPVIIAGNAVAGLLETGSPTNGKVLETFGTYNDVSRQETPNIVTLNTLALPLGFVEVSDPSESVGETGNSPISPVSENGGDVPRALEILEDTENTEAENDDVGNADVEIADVENSITSKQELSSVSETVTTINIPSPDDATVSEESSTMSLNNLASNSQISLVTLAPLPHKSHGTQVDKIFCNIDNIHVMRDSLNKLTTILNDLDRNGGAGAGSNTSVGAALSKTQWLHHLSLILQSVDRVTKSIHLNNTNVIIHCSDGWDRTSQVSALLQLCLDPYYRTMAGFMVLVEKEWVSFGFKFGTRGDHGGCIGGIMKRSEGARENNPRDRGSGSNTSAITTNVTSFLSRAAKHIKNTASGSPTQSDSEDGLLNLKYSSVYSGNNEKSPVFHQFLECVYQILRQHPGQFEFNSRFLKRLFYHYYSCQYGTFLADSERECLEVLKLQKSTVSVWDYFNSRPQEFLNRNWSDPEDVVFFNYTDIKWWFELYGRSEEEMNGFSNSLDRKFREMRV